MTRGFGTHNWWAAFRGWFWAHLTRKKNVTWTTNRQGLGFPYHIVRYD
jgi:hypothetical protein